MAIIPLIASGTFHKGDVPDVVVFDKYCHASLSYHKPIVEQYTKDVTIDHNDIETLENICKNNDNVVYIADGVYSMGGNCPVQELLRLQEEYNGYANKNCTLS